MGTLLSNLLKPRTEAIGLELGAANLKLVELRGRAQSLRTYGIKETPPGTFNQGMIAEPSALVDQLKELLNEARPQRKHVVTALANDAVVTRIIEVPAMEKGELAEAVRWEAESQLPFPIDEVVLDFAVLDDPQAAEEKDRLEVLVAATREETVLQLVDVLQQAGLYPLVVDLKPFAGLRTLSGQITAEGEEAPTHTAFLEIGAESSSLVILRGERPLLVRTINIGGHHFTQALARELRLEPDKAEALKREQVFIYDHTVEQTGPANPTLAKTPKPSDISRALKPVVDKLTSEVSQSFYFIKNQHNIESIDAAYIAGGGSKLKGLKDYLANHLGTEFIEIDPWQEIRVDPARFDTKKLQELGPEFVVPVGLALRGVSNLD